MKESNKLPKKEVFDILPESIKKKSLKNFFKDIINNVFVNNLELQNNISNLINNNIYPSSEFLIEVKKLKQSLNSRNCPKYKNTLLETKIRKKKKLSKKIRRNRIHQYILKNNKLNTNYLSDTDIEIWKKHFKFLHNSKLHLVDYKILFDVYKSYKKQYLVKDDKFNVLYPVSYIVNCCNCENPVIISRNFQIDISELFCIDCDLDLEKGALYLDTLIKGISDKLKNVQKIKNKILK